MRWSIIVVVLALLICMSGCGVESPIWEEEDFSFYDTNGKEKMFPTKDDYWIRMSECEGLRTHRGVEIGDRASNIADIYDLTDFEYSICDFSKLRWSTDEAEEYEQKLIAEGKTVEDVLQMLPEISAEDLGVYLHCDIYEKGGKLFTESGFGEITSEMVIEYFGYRPDAPITDREVSMYKLSHLKYSISFEIEHEKIIEVSVESTYHNRL